MKNFYTLLLLLLATVIASAQVSYSFTSQTADYQTTTKQSYKVVSSSKANGFTEQIGAPQLPVFTKRLVLPAGSVVTNVVVSNQSSVLLNSNIYLYPSQLGKSQHFSRLSGLLGWFYYTKRSCIWRTGWHRYNPFFSSRARSIG